MSRKLFNALTDDLAATVERLVAEDADIPIGMIRGASSLRSLGIDTDTSPELFDALEETFVIDIDDGDAIGALRTVGDLTELVRSTWRRAIFAKAAAVPDQAPATTSPLASPLASAPLDAAVHAYAPHNHVSVIVKAACMTEPVELLIDPRMIFADAQALAENIARRLGRDATTLPPR